jgi:hypothetical protein
MRALPNLDIFTNIFCERFIKVKMVIGAVKDFAVHHDFQDTNSIAF